MADPKTPPSATQLRLPFLFRPAGSDGPTPPGWLRVPARLRLAGSPDAAPLEENAAAADTLPEKPEGDPP